MRSRSSRTRTRAARGVLVAAWAGAGCRSLVDPPLPSGAESFAPPPVYARWWAMTEACSGITRDFAELNWYVVPQASSFPSGSSGEANGTYSNHSGRITLAGQSQLDATVVRHEMLHALLRSQAGHPRPYFLERCAGTVRCGPACVTDGGPAPVPPSGTPTVPLASLRVSAELSPAAPTAAGDGGWYTLTVTATNPAATPVVTARPGYGVGFGFEAATDPPTPIPALGQVTSSTYGADVPVYDESTRQFAAGETKRHVFDVHVVARPEEVPDRGDGRGDTRVLTGRYTLRGVFGGRGAGPWSPVVSATLAP